MYQHRCMIVPAQLVEFVRTLAAVFPSTKGIWTRGCSASGSAPAEAFISSGPVGADLADILPLTTWAQDSETGEWSVVDHQPGNSEFVVQAATAAGVSVSVATVEQMFSAVDVTTQDAYVALARRGLSMFDMINANTATVDELVALPDIGESLAAVIVADRPWSSLSELTKVPGIGPNTINNLQPWLTV